MIYLNYRLARSVTWPLRCWIAQSMSRTLSLLNRYGCQPQLIEILNYVFRVMFTQWVSLSGKWLQECPHLSILVPHHSHLIGILLELTPAWMKCERCSAHRLFHLLMLQYHSVKNPRWSVLISKDQSWLQRHVVWNQLPHLQGSNFPSLYLNNLASDLHLCMFDM